MDQQRPKVRNNENQEWSQPEREVNPKVTRTLTKDPNQHTHQWTSTGEPNAPPRGQMVQGKVQKQEKSGQKMGKKT